MRLDRIERSAGCRVSDEWAWRGLRTLVLENELLRVVVLLDKGSDIVAFEYKPLGLDLMWKNPTGGVVPPSLHVPTRGLSEGVFSDFYEGGWQECLPNGGRYCEYQGTDQGLHGEVWGLPWSCDVIEDSPECVAARLAVRTRRTPFLLEKTLRLRAGAARLEIEETLTNESAYDIECMWGHHPAFGAPFLSEACVVTTGARTAHVDYGGDPESRFTRPWSGPLPLVDGVEVLRLPGQGEVISDMLYLTDLAEGFYAITNTHLGVGFGLSFDPELFRCLWFWIACNAPRKAPFWGRSYTVALEPFTSWPAILSNAIERGTALRLGPHESIRTRLEASAFAAHSGPATLDELAARSEARP